MVTLAATPLAARAASAIDIPVATSPQQVAVADLNHDGFNDLVVGTASGVSVLLGHGDGTFGGAQAYALGAVPGGAAAIGDFNGDGKLDVVTATGLLIGNGDGTFLPSGSGFGIFNVNSVTTGDLNGDGKLDVVVASVGNTAIFLGNGDGSFRFGPTYPSGNWARLADMNRDGRLDLIIPDYTGTAVMLGNGDGTFGSPVVHFSYGIDAVVGDLNGDGIPDIVTLSAANNGVSCLNYALGHADGTFAGGGSCGIVGSRVALGDFDSDGHLDIFTSGYGSSAQWLHGNGDGSFGPPSAVIVGAPGSSHFVAIADLNKDGHDDIVLTNQSGSSVSVLLGPLGAPAPGSAVLSPTSLTFDPLPAWQTSLPQTVTLKSNGPGPLIVAGWQTSGGFNVTTSDCPLSGSLAAGLTCTYSVVFAPTDATRYARSLTVTDSDPSGSQSVNLYGTGLANLTTTTVDSVTTASGTPANFRAVVSSNGKPPIAGGQVVFHLPNGASFTSNLDSNGVAGYFGYDTAALMPGYFPNGIRADFLGGNGYAASTGYADLTVTSQPTSPKITLSPVPLDFGSVGGGTIAHGLVTITNSGNASYHFVSATVTGDFSIPQINCPYPVPPGASCYVYVDFTPTQPGTRNGTLTVIGDDPTSPDTSALIGFGTMPVSSLSPGAIDFGAVLVSATGTARVIVTNSGTGPLQVNGYSISGADAMSFHAGPDTCGALVAAGASCSITISFSNPARGSYAATLSVSDNAAGSPHVAGLAARAVAPVVSLAPNPLVFGTINGGMSASAAVTLTNVGDAPYHFGSASATGDFRASQNTCSSPVAAGGNCSIAIDFAPSLPGSRSGSLIVTGDDVTATDVAILSGFGVMPQARLSPASLSYSAQDVGTSSAAQSVTVANSGNAPLTISSASIVGPNASDFRISSSGCGAPISAGTSCSMTVVFTPTSFGSRGATLQLVDNSPDLTQTIAVSGTGVASSLSTAPAAIAFGTSRIGQSTGGIKLTITNIGNAPLRASSVAITGANYRDFAISSDGCPITLAAGASCAIALTFKPTGVGTRLATLTFVTNGVPATVSVPLTGTGTKY